MEVVSIQEFQQLLQSEEGSKDTAEMEMLRALVEIESPATTLHAADQVLYQWTMWY